MAVERDSAPSAIAGNQGQVAEALVQLWMLLEEYAPSWYTQEHHKLAEAALSPSKAR